MLKISVMSNTSKNLRTLATLLALHSTASATDCDLASLEKFRAVFIGNSLTGGHNVGGRNPDPTENCVAKPFPWPEQQPSSNPGDVPSKVKKISDNACQMNFEWVQNSRSAHFLSTHARDPTVSNVAGCKFVNRDMITDTSSQEDSLDILIIQAQSNELNRPHCQPTALEVASADTLLNDAPAASAARKMLYGLWAGYNSTTAITTFESLQCTQKTLANMHKMDVAPVGESFRFIADQNCNKSASGTGYDERSCEHSLWSSSAQQYGGLFDDHIHQSEASGSWLSALVIYASMQSPVCLPSVELFPETAGLSGSVSAELVTAAQYAIVQEYGHDLSPCGYDDRSENTN